MSAVSLGEIGKAQRGKSISLQSYHFSLTAGLKLLQSVYIFLYTKPNASVLTVKVQRHKDLMEYTDLADAA